MDFLADFLENVYKFLTNQSNFSEKCCLIKKSTNENGKSHGDFSFSIKFSFWTRYLGLTEDNCDNILNYLRPDKTKNEILEEMISESDSWNLKIGRAELVEDRCFIFLDRQKTIKTILSSILSDENLEFLSIIPKKNGETINLELQSSETSSITYFRTKLVFNVTKNLIGFSPYKLVDQEEGAKHKFLVTTKSNFSKSDENIIERKKILCGVVVDSKNGNKIAEVTAEDYIK